MEKLTCPACGATMPLWARFCPNCGVPVEHTEEGTIPGEITDSECSENLSSDAEDNTQASSEENACNNQIAIHKPLFSDQKNEKPKKASKRTTSILVSCIAVVAVVIIGVVIKANPVPKSISFSGTSYSVTIGSSGSVDYSITPAKARKRAEVTWASSDPNICTVNASGQLHPKKIGTCTISATTKNGKVATYSLTVEPDYSDFSTLYNTYLSSSYARLASDGSYLSIDTNPYDWDDYTNEDAIVGLRNVVSALGLPDSLLQKMGSTRALDGRQTETYSNVEVSWSYHPDDGLEVLFTKN